MLSGLVGPETWKLAGQFTGTYTGGGVNFAALGQALGHESQFFLRGHRQLPGLRRGGGGARAAGWLGCRPPVMLTAESALFRFDLRSSATAI